MPVLIHREVLFSADGPTSSAAPTEAALGTGRSEQPASGVAAKPVAETASAPAAAKSGRVRRLVVAGVVLLALVAGGRYAFDYFWTGWYRISTDDAYVKADVASISAKVGGFVIAFPVAENTAVAPDTVIAEIDDGDYRLALESAMKKAETQRATIDRFDSQLAQADAAIGQAQAQVDSNEADAKRTEADFVRYTQLVKDKVAAPQRLEQAVADRDKAQDSVVSAKAAFVSARTAKAVLAAQQQEARHTLNELQVQVDKAARDLSFTKVRAAVGGVFANKGVSVGTLIQPGSRFGALIADGSLYVEANFKETQIRDLRAGQAATLQVDALGGITLQGTVESFAPGSGAVFSLLPPENATGNFTKIVQRFPVRIALPADQRTVRVLRPGMSVVVTVDTKSQPSGGSSLASDTGEGNATTAAK